MTTHTTNPNIAKVVQLTTHARLHMGFFDLHGGLGRKFGSLGLTLSAPSLVMKACAADKLIVNCEGDSRTAQRAIKTLQALQSTFHITQGVKLDITQSIPRHAGLGSGTQLAIGLTAMLNALFDLGLNEAQIAEHSSRGARSGIGLGAFFNGGVLVDAGRGSATNVPPIVARAHFPDEWRIILISDNSQEGVHGALEVAAFEHLPVFSPSLAEKLCHHVLMQALPALHEHDLPNFGAAVRALQMATGEHFAAAQGGLYASKKVEDALNYLENQHVKCFGQSSWGPTGFAIVESENEALALIDLLVHKYEHLIELSFSVCSGNNHGANMLIL